MQSSDKFGTTAYLSFIPQMELLAKVMHRSWCADASTKEDSFSEKSEHAFAARIKCALACDIEELYNTLSSHLCTWTGKSGKPGKVFLEWMQRHLHDFTRNNNMNSAIANNLPVMLMIIGLLCMKETVDPSWFGILKNYGNNTNDIRWLERMGTLPFEPSLHPVLLKCSSRMLVKSTQGKGFLKKSKDGLWADPRGEVCPDKKHLNVSDFRIRFSFPKEKYTLGYK